jgi:3-oxoacyl-[acyl-carrier protein] reductase
VAVSRFELESGRRVLVTGGAGGIGRALVAALVERGAEVAVLDLPAALDRHPPPAGVRALACDVANERAVAAAFAGVGPLDGLVTLAGFARPTTSLADAALPDWSAVLEANLDGTFLAVRAALPLLRKGRDPAIVTMASGLALKASPGYAGYGVAKAGIIALTKLVAAEEAPSIRCNAVAPAAVDTAFLRGGTAHGAPDRPLRLDLDRYLPSVPLGRLATPDDVVGPILFLLSPAARYVTGQTLHINGGSLMP